GDPASPSQIKKIYQISLAGATDVSDPTDSTKGLLISGVTLEKLVRNQAPALAQVTLTTHGITPVTKVLKVDVLKELAALGKLGSIYGHDKIEGLSIIDGGRQLVISNDDDFGITSTDPSSFNIAPKIVPTTGKADSTELLFIDLQNLPSQSASATVSLEVR